ncbi:MAG: DNA alkylation repair protein, partial [Tannerellaceae bacterium]|nr:DNA alkylation repair protein [Tannerellaceae bacterium]
MQEEIIKAIRGKLRRFMNGVVSESMRRQGIIYKLNFGVSLPQLKEIAGEYTPSRELAEELWKKDVRELKLLSILLYPPQELTFEKAYEWIGEIAQPELAEQMALSLLPGLSYAGKLAAQCISDTDEYRQTTGFLLFSKLFLQNKSVEPEYIRLFMNKSIEIMDKGISRPQRAALNALKRYGRQK